MAITRGTVNPLNVLGVRTLTHIPFHFAKTYTDNLKFMTQIDEWMYSNLNSRYCVKKAHIVDRNNKIVEVCEIGVEDAKELTMLTLGCPYLYKS